MLAISTYPPYVLTYFMNIETVSVLLKLSSGMFGCYSNCVVSVLISFKQALRKKAQVSGSGGAPCARGKITEVKRQ